jgi:hemophore-related protein
LAVSVTVRGLLMGALLLSGRGWAYEKGACIMGSPCRTAKVVITVGGWVAGVVLSPAMGIASAAPDIQPVIQTTCSYDQIVAALRVVNPPAAGLLDQYPEAQGYLRDFVGLPVDQREQRLNAYPQWQQRINSPSGQQTLQTLTQVADTCHNY